MQLVQNIKFKAKTKTKNCARVVKHVNYSYSVRAHSLDTWNTGHLLVPPVCPSSNNISQLVNVKYSIVLTIGTIDSKNFDLVIPIVIGSVPLRDQTQNYDPLSNDLPSYETCMFGSSYSGETHVWSNSEEPEFIPSYPVYNNTTRY